MLVLAPAVSTVSEASGVYGEPSCRLVLLSMTELLELQTPGDMFYGTLN